ncbi:PREDICTED: multiple RNA-binding domain-containing protein 1 isoform X1 [Tarenaya hassleriana]|uniref:multiple RNA-binding domain-containing protein 1 isoform X1 n=1 Tax=Tarenaya hassleriana TaxID=28532 RepID=UPI00053C9A7A|nr:PREDICTED: multiple RNA-binding domain-containing protein 1 isoform X1 [Tarenaya hassleriana]
MSRICVKNLPKHVTEDRLRDVFSQKGEITDAKVIRCKDGKTRQFAFIGFRSEDEAQEAIKYFNKSYLDTSRIFCEIARKVGDPDAPRPWSRHTLKKQGQVKENIEKSSAKSLSTGVSKGERKNKKKTEEVDDPQLQEFLEVMQRGKSKMWSNDMLIASTTEQIKDKVSVKRTNDQIIPSNAELIKEKEASDMEAKKEDAVHGDDVSDMEYFKSRIKKKWVDSESDSETDRDSHEAGDGDNIRSGDGETKTDDDNDSAGDFNSDDDGDTGGGDTNDGTGAVSSGYENAEQLEADGKTTQDVKDGRENILETGRLFVRNLPYSATEDELQEHFSEYGEISEVHLVLDKETKRSKGIAYIMYTVPESAARALEELDNSIFQGRLLHILPAKQRETSDKQVTDESNQSKTFKQKREEEKKASEVSGDTKAWNSLFMRPDTILENIVRAYGVSKSDLLDRESDDPAVRLALGETKVIAETKEALAKAGVNVNVLEEFASRKADDSKRSKHILLVKNLPFASSEKELAQMFGKFGNLDKVILPPTRTMALIVFLEPSEARAAFKGLAYKRYKDAPLYLEWAPGDILEQKTPPDNDGKESAVGEHDVKRVLLEQQVEGITNEEIDPDRNESRMLYVKNLNFKTSDETLKKHLSELVKQGQILSVRIKMHIKNGKNLSSGYGFVEFDSVDTATNAYRDLQGTVLDGHALILRFCQTKRSDSVGKADKDKQSTKLHVKNVAFEATKKDLRQLFSPFGQIKSLRLPSKLGDREHRGYAFVEFMTKQEALNAMKALSNTHLYGRHLLLEWAEDDESMEKKRKRSAAKYMDEQSLFENPSKALKKGKRTEVVDESRMKFERIAEAD